MKVLIVSPFFPPYSLVGANRMKSLSAFLAERGYNVTVWAHDRATLLCFSDESTLLSEAPEGVKILRFSVPTEAKKRYLVPLLYIKQVRACIREAKKQLNKERFDIIIMSCGPTYQQGAVLRYAKRKNIPLIMDMRDLDVLDGISQEHNCFIGAMQNIFWKSQQFHKEKKCMKYAEKIVLTVPGADTDVVRAYGIPQEKTLVIYNGYDEKLLASLPESQKESDVLRVGFFGKLMCYSSERGEMLFRALDVLCKNGIRIELYHVGQKCPQAYDVIKKFGLSPQVYNYMGAKDYREGMALMKNADMFAIEYLDPKGLGTKLYDYIFLNKPIICISPKGCVIARMVSSFENGFSCDSIEEIIGAIKRITDEQLKYLDRKADLTKYARRCQNEKYEKLLIEIENKY